VQPRLLDVADFGEGAAQVGFRVGVFGIDADRDLKLCKGSTEIAQ